LLIFWTGAAVFENTDSIPIAQSIVRTSLGRYQKNQLWQHATHATRGRRAQTDGLLVVALVHDAAAFGEDVQGPLLGGQVICR
jgi:hypothetical protein